jgi:hypothetical protein
MRARGGACGGDGTAVESWQVGETAKTAVDEKTRLRSNRTVKRVRSAFCVMTERGGRMTGRGGDCNNPEFPGNKNHNHKFFLKNNQCLVSDI